MRGKQRLTGCVRGVMWNIPAYAGKTVGAEDGDEFAEEHPRVCGENPRVGVGEGLGVGTSPRMRGKLSSASGSGSAGGNIPAYAGKTVGAEDGDEFAEEHPRVCGENLNKLLSLWQGVGTSPRMRGKLG